ncbi:MAG: ribose-phosphate pyrophosphokinase [Candidatus Levybacteria bacterium]|nr:ribose-phosphate pyrophosphokinase [Candidatus Levybacteria bacterium]MDZ4228396.1 ribose-phosphate pyrophosphokinase [Candidatus Levybacteria bacterium]
MKIFSGTSNKPLAEKIAKNLGLNLSPLEIFKFPDGEKRVRVMDKVVNEDCVVVQPTSPEPDKSYMELFFIVDALKRSGAKSVTAVISYLGYQRQDHIFREGEAVSLEAIATLLKWCGVDEIISFDLHSIKIPEIFKIKLNHLSALSIFAGEIKELGDNSVLVSPDMGGIRRIKILSEMLGNMPFAVIEKNRDLASGSITMTDIKGEVQDRDNAIIVDDMISTGGTIVTAAKLLKSKGVKNIYVFATHAVFSKDAPNILSDAILQKVFVTDTIDIPKNKQFFKLEILSVSEIIAHALRG